VFGDYLDTVDEIKRKKMEELKQKISIPDHPLIATDENFDQLLNENKMVLVDFWAEWCMPCKMFGPTIEEFAKDMKGRVTVAKLNVDESRGVAMKYNTMSIPTTILFKDGKPIDKMIGAVPKERLIELIKRYE